MNTERNLLFATLAFQAGMIDADQLLAACKLWQQNREKPLADLLRERDWLQPADCDLIEHLIERKLLEQGGNPLATLLTALAGLEHLLTPANNAEIQRFILGLVRTTDSSADKTRMEFTDPLMTLAKDTAFVAHELRPPAQRYTLNSLHASGGMGRVWLAHDTYIGRDVALKELRLESMQRGGSIPVRFLREARITAQLEHPGVVPVYDLGKNPVSGQPFYTMRFVGGRTLSNAAAAFHKNRLAGVDDPLELVRLLTAFVSVCHTIAYSHSRGIVHRDLKGENIVLGEFGEVIVLDWGLAKRFDVPEEDLQDPEPLLPEQAERTIMGQVVGTPAYMAPEQAAGRQDLIGPRTDIFGLGAILYEILTGRPPFAGETTGDVVWKAMRADFVAPHDIWSDVPPALEQACLRALAWSPENRFASGVDLAREIQMWQERQRREAEDASRKSRELLQGIVDNSSASIAVKDLQGRYLLINRLFETLYQVQREQFIQKTDSDLPLRRDQVETIRALDRQVIETGQPIQTEEQIRQGSETHTYLSVRFPILDSDGKPLAVCGIATDITERKRMEERLLENERRLSRINAALGELTLRDPQALGFEQYVRGILEVAARTLGVERASYWRFSESRDQIVCVDRFDNPLGRHAGAGEVLRLADFPSYFAALQNELFIDAVDARTDPRTAEFTSSYLLPNDIHSMLDALVRRRSQVFGVVCLERQHSIRHWRSDEIGFAVAVANLVSLGVEVATRLRAEQELAAARDATIDRTQQAIYRTAFALAPTALLLFDSSGKILDCNHAAQQLLGGTRQQWIGRPSLEILGISLDQFKPSRHEPPSTPLLSDSLTARSFLLHWLRPDGVHLQLQITVQPALLEEGHPFQGCVVVLQEVSSLSKPTASGSYLNPP